MQHDKRIAYFTMEAGIYNYLRCYGGGLGILSGDEIKGVIDSNGKYPITFFTILWKKGYYLQRINERGEIVDYEPTDNAWADYLVDTGKEVEVKIFDHPVYAKIWKLKTGPVYYLDTDLEKNHGFCNITHHLYGGAWDNAEKERIAQEIVLGIGGVRAIEALGLEIDGYHYNDGHPAFAGLELISKRMEYLHKTQPNLSDDACFENALRYVKERTVFTTHTNVPAGNESHPIDLLMEVGANAGLTRKQLEHIGGKPFGMTIASFHMACKANGVSELHAKTAKDLWHNVNDMPEIIAITNGVHPGTWWDPGIKKAFLAGDLDGIYDAHEKCTIALIDYIKERTGVQFSSKDPVIVFARRATEYKRWDLIFREEKLFDQLVKEENIQLVFAGKAHTKDAVGKAYISKVIEMSKRYPKNVVFLEGYDIALAQKLETGGHIWLNNPRTTFEACGTSGMKGAFNGTINVSTPDGWCPESIVHGVNGFYIGNGECTTPEQDYMDAQALMKVLKDEVIPAFKDKKVWKNIMYNSIATAQRYDIARMLDDYYEKLYSCMA